MSASDILRNIEEWVPLLEATVLSSTRFPINKFPLQPHPLRQITRDTTQMQCRHYMSLAGKTHQRQASRLWYLNAIEVVGGAPLPLKSLPRSAPHPQKKDPDRYLRSGSSLVLIKHILRSCQALFQQRFHCFGSSLACLVEIVLRILFRSAQHEIYHAHPSGRAADASAHTQKIA